MATPDLTGLSATELAAVEAEARDRLAAARLAAQTIEQTVRQSAATDVDKLIALAGPPAAEAAPSDDSINGLLAFANADINANPARYFKAALRVVRAILKAVVPALRVAGQRFDSTETGN